MIKIPIIFEDNHLLVINKPPNILSQGDKTGDADILSLLKQDLKKRYNKLGNVYLGLIHRLDRPVGGVMVLAKTSKAASRLSNQIRNREFQKTYIAIVHGNTLKSKDILTHYLLKDKKTNTVSAVSKSVRQAKEAILEYEVIDKKQDFSLVKINLHTGRPHQIRVQFATIGYPLYGDQKYGVKNNNRRKQIALNSYKITFRHPTLKEVITFTSYIENQHPWDKFSNFLNINQDVFHNYDSTAKS
ncbi:RNA pseudouridylate synthase, group 1 [Candidatus Syntrophocurvum alkaliphilum]|uniref:RNA pseudouridylate synthase n=1 Tax=Candidatus Syntrophocurvum alkaliphilum TaxID=2293317 RepID=A0A6I6D9F5_9FIRM|nr:RluA family pseudouridine synthase [Candidatus Syntrophocurvum alkaliphilum]QGT99465.1 RNA pseudouridylate synthase, group 1 [Candidatus Syntrophocurvum alkaliphilum]